MAVFGLIPTEKNGAINAVSAALEMQDAVKELQKIRSRQNKNIYEIGIGINTGNPVVGNIGAENRMDYTVIGDSVNVASKLEEMAEGGEIIIGEKTHTKVHSIFRTLQKKDARIQNKSEPVVCYYVLKTENQLLDSF